MQPFKLTRLAFCLAAAASLAACSEESDMGQHTATEPMLLDAAQEPLADVLTQVCTGITDVTPAESPVDIGGFVCALEATVNNAVDGPDSLITNLVTSLQALGESPSPEQLQATLTSLQAAITGEGSNVGVEELVTQLASDLPCALLTLAKQECVAGDTPQEQLQAYLDLLAGGNPFADTPLEPLGDAASPILQPLVAALGTVFAAAPGTSLDGEVVDALGTGLTDIGNLLVSGYNIIPGAQQIPVAGELVATLGNLVSGLGTTLDSLETGTGGSVGDVLDSTLTDVVNLLTADTGLLGALADASGQQQLVDAVATGNEQLNGLVDDVTTALDTSLLQPLDESALNPLLGALAPLTCTLQLFGDCAEQGDPLAEAGALLGLLSGSDLGADNPLSGLLDQVTSALGGGDTSALTDLLAGTPLEPLVGLTDTLSEAIGGGNATAITDLIENNPLAGVLDTLLGGTGLLGLLGA